MARRWGAAALPPILYLVASLLIFGLPVVDHLQSVQIGYGTDPAAFQWILKWWPEAIANEWDPIHTHVVFAPAGFNMTWVTSIPGPSLLLAPITQTLGPIASYNVLSLLAPVADGWAAYLLCRSLDARYLPSIVGGYVFAFSTYVISATVGGHPFLSLIPFPPLAAFLVVQRLGSRLSGRWFVAALTATLSFQFLTSTETFLVLTMVAVAMLALGYYLYAESRLQIVAVAKLILVAYAITGLIVSPLLVASVSESSALSAVDPIAFATDPVNLVIPTTLTNFGGSLLESVSSRYTGNLTEQGAYLGIPLLLVVIAFAAGFRRSRLTALLSAGFVAMLLASLGPRLNLLGDVTAIRLPWTPFIHLPFFKFILPARLIVFAWLFAAVILALWLSTARRSWMRWAWAGVVVLSLLPSAGGAPWSYEPPRPELFRGERIQRLVDGDPGRALMLPYPPGGNALAMLWQAEAGMGFEQAGGYVSATVPHDYECWPLVGHLRSEVYGEDVRPEIPSFMASKHITAIISTPEAAVAAAPLLSGWFPPPVVAEGMYVYRVPNWMRALPSHACPPGSG